MFDIGRSRFYKKIRHLLKLSKTRVDTIIKKRNAILKYLKNDVAELLGNGLDVNAFGRAEGLLEELNMLSCYNFIEHCVGCILANLSAMESQRECPDECREAAQSLMHAAARLADMPELRELRTVFTERYGNSLEPFLNKEFAEKLRSGPPTKEKKLQLLQDIAQEYSIPFDPVPLEQEMFKPAPLVQEKRVSSIDAGDDGYEHHTQRDVALSERDGRNRGNKMREKPKHRSSYDAEDDGSKWQKRKDDSLPERDGHNRGNNISNLREHEIPKRNEEDLRCHRKKGLPDDRYNIPCSSEDEVLGNSRRSSSSSSQDSQQSSSSSVGSFSEEEAHSRKHCYYGSIPPPYVKQNYVNESNGSVNAEQNDQSQPTSARKRSPKHRHASGNVYPSPVHGSDDTVGARRDRRAKSELPRQPARATSILSEPAAGHEGTRGHHPAKSMPPEMGCGLGHVHPKLPDYDDLAAQLAALGGK